jgi:hypothetical protein
VHPLHYRELNIHADIQSWAAGKPISNKSAQRIFAVADKILKAGTEQPT